MLFNSIHQSLHPRINTADNIRAEVDDFFDRHIDAIAEAIKDKDVIHTCPYPPGKRIWMFTWRWPFIRTWKSTAICCCEINQILSGHRETMRLIDEIVRALRSTGHAYDLYAGFSQEPVEPAAPVDQTDQGQKET